MRSLKHTLSSSLELEKQVRSLAYCFKIDWPTTGDTRCLGGKESACQCRRRRRHRFDPWIRKIFCRRKWQPTLVSLPGKSHGQRSLEGYTLWGLRELDMTEQLSMHDEILMSATSHFYIKDKGIESHIYKIETMRDQSRLWTGQYGVSSSISAAL